MQSATSSRLKRSNHHSDHTLPLLNDPSNFLRPGYLWFFYNVNSHIHLLIYSFQFCLTIHHVPLWFTYVYLTCQFEWSTNIMTIVIILIPCTVPQLVGIALHLSVCSHYLKNIQCNNNYYHSDNTEKSYQMPKTGMWHCKKSDFHVKLDHKITHVV